jgi:hypothetical protein
MSNQLVLYRSKPRPSAISLVPSPWRPRSVKKRKARMIPPMLAATPLNAETSGRNHRGRVAVAAAYAIMVPNTTPSSADTNDNFIEP